jgi:hypothetical protein
MFVLKPQHDGLVPATSQATNERKQASLSLALLSSNISTATHAPYITQKEEEEWG